jgi:hypothetical protein
MHVMRSFVKAIVTTTVVLPVVLGGASVAMADDGPGYHKAQNSATVSGGKESHVHSGFGHDGTAYFSTSALMATPTGATGSWTGSHS